MPQNLIWLVPVGPTDTGSRDPSARPAPEPRRPRSSHTARQAPWRSAAGRRSGRRACRHASRHTRRSMFDGGEDPAPAVVHREHPNAIGAPHEVRGMSDDLTVMVDCRHGGGSDGARADCSRALGGAPACGQPGCRDRPEAEPRPCGSPRPPRAMPPGRLRSPPAAPGPRSRASVPDALPACCSACWPEVMA